ncbi:succinylglutamate desuccinylase/aspartoacylase family protein [Myroides odoratus]|uniref:succinylglutamate desuccinylase/aspartoacylase family protein n=1 Tax=Myroides odoratus TaxID=256 RepID=UPI0039AFA0CA
MRKVVPTLVLITMLMFTISTLHAQSIAETLHTMKQGERLDKIITLDQEQELGYIPVSLIKGKYPGKVFTIVAGIHGYEYPPITAVQELLKELKPDELHGTLIVLPLANVASFYKRSPFVNPIDYKNLNTTFPGSETGSLTEKIAHWISTEVILNSDVFLDIHGGDAGEDLIPFICYYNNESNPQTTKEAHLLSEASQMEYIVSYPYDLKKTDKAKYAFKQAVQNDIVALSIEAGKLGTVQKENVELIKNAVYHMLAYATLYKNEPKIEIPNQTKTYLRNQTYVKVEQKGLFYSSIAAGDNVIQGQEIGTITDEFGQVLNQVKSPVTGIVLYKTGTPPVNKGETLFCIGHY